MSEELGAVVLRPEDGRRGLLPLRPLLVCALFLLLVEILLRLTLPPDPRPLLSPLHPYGCFREEELARLVAARAVPASPPALDVVLLGDSVLSSTNNGPGERIEDALLPRLQGALFGRATVRLWSLGRGGAHAADQYAALLQLQGALSPRTERLLVVLSTNVIFFSQRHRSPAMLYPCLGDALRVDPAAQALLHLPPPPSPLERHLAGWLTRNVYLFQQRRRVSETLFGGPPREALREGALGLLGRLGLRPKGALGAEVTDRNAPWTARGLSAAQFAASYDFIPLSSKEATNHQLTQRLAAHLGRMALPSFVFLVPQNHGLLGPLAAGPAYEALSAALFATFRGAAVPFRSYDGLLADALFTDLDHLSAAGNERLAALLAKDLAPRLLRLLEQSPPAP